MRNHRSPKKLFAALLLGAVISACGGRATVLPSPIPSQTIDPASSPAIHKSNTSAPTATVQSSLTQTPQPSPTEQKDTNAPLSDLDRYELLHTQVATFPKTCENTISNINSISPDNRWLASSCGKRDQTMEVVNRDGDKYTLFFRDYVSSSHFVDGHPPSGGLYPIQYTDENYLYFYSVVGYSGGGTCFYGVGVHGLYRIDLNTGVIYETLPLTSSLDGYLIAISPDGNKLAYNHYNLPDPILLDLTTREKVPLVDDEAQAGSFFWSPDGRKLVYATCQGTEDGSAIVRSTVQLYDLETGATTVILDAQGHFLEVESWNEEGLMKILDIDYVKRKDVYWYFDYNAGQLAKPTVVPVR